MTSVPITQLHPLARDELRARLLAPSGPLARLEVVDETGSTNDDMVAALRVDPGAWPDVSVLVADHQTGGHGRAGRTWVTPPGTSVTCTLAIRALLPPVNFGWFPLLAGVAAVRALRSLGHPGAMLKWPNDVLLPAAESLDGWGPYRKVGGILAHVVGLGAGLGLAGAGGADELPGAGSTILLGVGLNVLQEPAGLAVPSATSLLAAGGRAVRREDVLVALVESAIDVLAEWRSVEGDAARSRLPAEVASVCATLGRRVRVELPGRAQIDGVAERIAADGSLVVADDSGGRHTVLAGDVRHVRTPA